MSNEITHNPHDKFFKEAFARRDMAVDFFQNGRNSLLTVSWGSADENGDENGSRVESIPIVHRSRRRSRSPKGLAFFIASDALQGSSGLKTILLALKKGRQEELREDIKEFLDERFGECSYAFSQNRG